MKYVCARSSVLSFSLLFASLLVAFSMLAPQALASNSGDRPSFKASKSNDDVEWVRSWYKGFVKKKKDKEAKKQQDFFAKASEPKEEQPKGKEAEPSNNKIGYAKERDAAGEAPTKEERPGDAPKKLAVGSFGNHEADDEEEKVSSTELDGFKLSDEEITARCRSAIAQNLEVVDTEDGRKVPKCVHTYETLRLVAVEYKQVEDDSVQTLKPSRHDCEGDQKKCLSAGDHLRQTAAAIHSQLGASAGNAEEKIKILMPGND
jgi:hypothetical protein